MPPTGLLRKGLVQNNIDTTDDLLKIRHLNAGIAQLVEHNLAKVGVASSSLVSRSRIQNPAWYNYTAGFFIARYYVSRYFRNLTRGIVTRRIVEYRAPGQMPGNFSPRPGGRVVMLRPAKPSTPVRFRPWPPISPFMGLSYASKSGF